MTVLVAPEALFLFKMLLLEVVLLLRFKLLPFDAVLLLRFKLPLEDSRLLLIVLRRLFASAVVSVIEGLAGCTVGVRGE